MAILASSSKSLQVSDLVKMFGRVFLRDLWAVFFFRAFRGEFPPEISSFPPKNFYKVTINIQTLYNINAQHPLGVH